MIAYQANINALVSALHAKGLEHAVISPGSRNAPLIMAFARYGKITCTSVPDERTAGFVALGMAKQLQKPVAAVCTSGTAVVNLYPAVAEAFYMQVPLLVISADRPEEMIDRWDGQTIRQFEIFGPHILGSFQTPENLDKAQINLFAKIAFDFYDESWIGIKGPVHLNVPLKEPLYQAAGDEFEYPEVHMPAAKKTEEVEWEMGIDSEIFFREHPRVMILLGAGDPVENNQYLEEISRAGFAVVIGDVISNAHAFQNIPNWESVLLNADNEQRKRLLPDLLITSGKMVLNKALKQLLRAYPPGQHWHIDENGYNADTFFTNPTVLSLKKEIFFEQLRHFLPAHHSGYCEYFKSLSKIQGDNARSGMEDAALFGELTAIRYMLQGLPDKAVLHLANSMTVRNVAYMSEHLKPGWKLYSNRGVSGIDGCTSTAVGMAMLNNDINILVTGDIAFYYDINALWQRQFPHNLKIILMNNFGGGIFRNIDGPSDLPELDPFLETPHRLGAGHMAAHFNLPYFSATNAGELAQGFPAFMAHEGAAILEVQTDSEINSRVFNQYKSIVL